MSSNKQKIGSSIIEHQKKMLLRVSLAFISLSFNGRLYSRFFFLHSFIHSYRLVSFCFVCVNQICLCQTATKKKTKKLCVTILNIQNIPHSKFCPSLLSTNVFVVYMVTRTNNSTHTHNVVQLFCFVFLVNILCFDENPNN